MCQIIPDDSLISLKLVVFLTGDPDNFLVEILIFAHRMLRFVIKM